MRNIKDKIYNLDFKIYFMFLMFKSTGRQFASVNSNFKLDKYLIRDYVRSFSNFSDIHLNICKKSNLINIEWYLHQLSLKSISI